MIPALMIFFQFIVLPILMGVILFNYFKEVINCNIFTIFVYGYFSVLTVYTAIGMVCSVFEIPYHVMKYSFLLLDVAIIASFLIISCFCRRNILNTIDYKLIKLNKKELIIFILFLLVLAYQVFLMIYTNGDKVKNDDSVYLPMINDTLYSDRIYLIDYSTGAIQNSVWENGIKYVGLPWFAILAFYADVFKVHPLFIYRTIFPIFTFIVLYMTMWIISGLFWNKKIENRLVFLLIFSLLVVNEETELVHGSSWGKIPVEFIGIIILTYTLYLLTNTQTIKNWYGIALLVISFPSVGMTTMTVMLYPIILCTWGILHIFRKKNYKIIPVVLIGMIPVVLQAGVIMVAKVLN